MSSQPERMRAGLFFLFAHCTISPFSFPWARLRWYSFGRELKKDKASSDISAHDSFQIVFARRIASFHVNDLMFC